MKRSVMIHWLACSVVLTALGTCWHVGAQPKLSADEEVGFQSIFDGKTLNGWDGDPQCWRVEDGVLIGETTPDFKIEQNTFLIWTGGTPGDFELKLECRIPGTGNSGVNYRSEDVPGVKWGLKGYQADIDDVNKWMGQNYEERGRGFLALRGQMTRLEAGKKPQVIGSLGDAEELKGLLHEHGWNECHLIVRGNVLIHEVNGRVMSVVVDDDPEKRAFEGKLGLQVHHGPPMKVEYRNIRIKLLPNAANR